MSASALDVHGTYADGLSRYAWADSSPLGRNDPLGLFGIVGGLMTGADIADMAMDALDQAYRGLTLVGLFGQFFDNAAIQQEFDVNWATDWAADDDWYANNGSVRNFQLSQGAFAFAAAGFPANLGWATRTHGGAWHDAWVKAYAEFYAAKYGAANVRMNQALVNGAGRLVSSLRPDVQVWDPKGEQYIIVEVADSQSTESAWSKRADYAKALGVNKSDVDFQVHDPSTNNRSMSAINLPRLTPSRRR